MVVKGKKAKSPPVFSHEFVIQNHADIVAVVAMVFIVGLMIDFMAPFASNFILLQHNVTLGEDTEDSPLTYHYRNGPKDMLTVFFYTLIMIIIHAVIQEYVIDKVNKKPHLSKVKFAKFNESGQLLVFYVFAFIFAANLLSQEPYAANISSLWVGYPDAHRLMGFSLKLFYILNLAYWLHIFPELYFQKVKKEDMAPKIQYGTLYFVMILAGYAMNFTRVVLVLLALQYLVEAVQHLSKLLYFYDKKDVSSALFKVWSTLFVVARFASVILSVLTFWFGLGAINAESPSFETSLAVRLSALAGICLLQAWMSWNFMTFFMRRKKEYEELAAAQRKSQQPTKKSNKKTKDEPNGQSKKKN